MSCSLYVITSLNVIDDDSIDTKPRWWVSLAMSSSFSSLRGPSLHSFNLELSFLLSSFVLSRLTGLLNYLQKETFDEASIWMRWIVVIWQNKNKGTKNNDQMKNEKWIIIKTIYWFCAEQMAFILRELRQLTARQSFRIEMKEKICFKPGRWSQRQNNSTFAFSLLLLLLFFPSIL